MQVSDVLGEQLKDALEILKKQHPSLEYDLVYYQQPRRRLKDNDSLIVERIVRQKIIHGNKLEIVVSFFSELSHSLQGKQ